MFFCDAHQTLLALPASIAITFRQVFHFCVDVSMDVSGERARICRRKVCAYVAD